MLAKEHYEGVMDIRDFLTFEGWRLPNTGSARVTDIPCSECREPLAEIAFNTTHYIYLCNNWHCKLFHRAQGTRLKEAVLKMKHPSRTGRPNYPEELRKAKQNYEYLIKVGIRAKLAARHKSNKQTKRIRGMVRRGLSPEFINRSLKCDY